MLKHLVGSRTSFYLLLSVVWALLIAAAWGIAYRRVPGVARVATAEQSFAGGLLNAGLLLFVVKLGLTVGAALPQVKQAGWALLFIAGLLVLGKRVIPLFGVIRDPVLLAFSTASSEAAYPRILDSLPKVGVRRRIVSFVLPLGYSFNLDGSMLYCTFATMFIVQAHGVELTVQQQIFMLLLLMVTSKGIAGVPRASLVVVAATLGRSATQVRSATTPTPPMARAKTPTRQRPPARRPARWTTRAV